MIGEHGASKEKRAEAIEKDERRELIEYCKAQGYTAEQTAAFVENSIFESRSVYLGE